MTGDVTWEQLVHFYARVAASYTSVALGFAAFIAEVALIAQGAPGWRVTAYAIGALLLVLNARQANLGAQEIAREVWKA